MILAIPAAATLLAGGWSCTKTDAYDPPDLFYLYAHYAVGRNPTTVTTADFNHDGVTDVVTTNIGNNTLSFLIGNGDGSFKDQIQMKVCAEPRALAVKDLNRDGLSDMAIVCAGSDQVGIYLAQPEGGFQQAHLYTLHKIPVSIDGADLDGNGTIDLAVALRNDKIKILLGRGNGEFSDGPFYEYGDTPTSLVLKDLNADGKPDLLVTNGGRMSNAVSVWMGRGDGSFAGPTDYRTGKRPLGVSVADFNNDKLDDLFVINGEMDTFTIFLGKGDGSFLPGKESGADAGPNYGVARDFDGDHILDVAIVNIQSNDLSILYGRGDGTFRYPPRNYRTKGGPFALADFSVMTEQTAIPGLVIANNGAGSVSVFLHRGHKQAPPAQAQDNG